jgi:soluble lytic murein transglycosylase-like protein
MLAGTVCLFASYFSFRYPIKQDRYEHAFRDHIIDRATAYLHLFRSPVHSRNRAMPVESIQQIIRRIADKHGVDACLVTAVVTFESGFNPNTITTTGAMGLMALQPETARVLGVQDAFDPEQNVDGGTRLLKDLSTSFDGDVPLVLAGYNAGSAAVKRHNGVPPFRETRDYADHVGTIYELCHAQRVFFLAERGDEAPPAGTE